MTAGTVAPEETMVGNSPARSGSFRLIAQVAAAAVVVVALIVLAIVASTQSGTINSQAGKITALQHQVKADSTALATFSKSSPAGFAKNLDSQLSALGAKNAALNTSLASTNGTVGQLQTRLAKICDPTKVSNEVSQLNGEETAAGYSQYYNDLFSVITSICQQQ